VRRSSRADASLTFGASHRQGNAGAGQRFRLATQGFAPGTNVHRIVPWECEPPPSLHDGNGAEDERKIGQGRTFELLEAQVRAHRISSLLSFQRVERSDNYSLFPREHTSSSALPIEG
jgi:hypothetical protein